MSDPYNVYKPTKIQVIAPIVVLVVTLLAGGIMLGVSKMLNVEHEKISYLAPGTNNMVLEPGNYTIYLLTEADYEGKHYSTPETFEALQYKVTFNGNEVTLEAPENEYSFGEGDDQGKTLKAFTAAETGNYVLETTVSSSTEPQVIVAVGKTDEHLQAVVTLTVISAMIILMGVLQFFFYLLLNGGKMAYYNYKKKVNS